MKCFKSVMFFILLMLGPQVAQAQDSRVTFDLGAALGTYDDVTYTEATFGVNYYALDWLIWRNAIFARLPSEGDNLFGLDSSLRAVLRTGDSRLGMTAFAGPGFRVVNEGDGAPFAEAGLIFRAGGFSVGGGVKSLYFIDPEPGAPSSDTQYFIILSGGASL